MHQHPGSFSLAGKGERDHSQADGDDGRHYTEGDDDSYADQDVLEAVVRLHSPLAGLSALMTTTVVSMEDTIKLLREQKPDCKVMVGGAVLNQDYADMIGADFYGKDAMQSVYYAQKLFEKDA